MIQNTEEKLILGTNMVTVMSKDMKMLEMGMSMMIPVVMDNTEKAMKKVLKLVANR